MAKPTTKRDFLKCLACGKLVGQGSYSEGRRHFTKGALGHQAVIVTQTVVGYPYGTNGGPSIWSRRPMNREELEHVAHAYTTASATIAERLEHAAEVTEDPADVLARVDDTEASIIGEEWIKEAADELARRQQIVDADMNSRTKRRE